MMKTYEETLDWILEIPRFTVKNTLEHTGEFLARLGNPQNEFKVIHVAGSNGKGSVCAYIDSVLRAAGKKNRIIYLSPSGPAGREVCSEWKILRSPGGGMGGSPGRTGGGRNGAKRSASSILF